MLLVNTRAKTVARIVRTAVASDPQPSEMSFVWCRTEFLEP